jgi:hypothetical protein
MIGNGTAHTDKGLIGALAKTATPIIRMPLDNGLAVVEALWSQSIGHSGGAIRTTKRDIYDLVLVALFAARRFREYEGGTSKLDPGLVSQLKAIASKLQKEDT